jgi:hypothetical protein
MEATTQRTNKEMKPKVFKNKILPAALLGATGAIALCAQQAFALGMMGGVAHVGGIGSARLGSVGMRAGASGMPGTVTMNGITVLPNGSLFVPAITPRVPTTGPSQDLRQLDPQQTTGAPCRTNVCAPY